MRGFEASGLDFIVVPPARRAYPDVHAISTNLRRFPSRIATSKEQGVVEAIRPNVRGRQAFQELRAGEVETAGVVSAFAGRMKLRWLQLPFSHDKGGVESVVVVPARLLLGLPARHFHQVELCSRVDLKDSAVPKLLKWNRQRVSDRATVWPKRTFT